MSAIGAKANRERATQEASVQEPGPRTWRGWVVQMTGGGMRWCRVALPESVMAEYVVRGVEPPDVRGIVAAKIETELTSDQFTEGRGWPR